MFAASGCARYDRFTDGQRELTASIWLRSSRFETGLDIRSPGILWSLPKEVR